MLIFSFHLTLCSDSSNGLHLSQIDSQPLWVPIHCAPAADSFVVVIIFKIKTSVACQRPPAATWEKNNVKRNNRWCSTAFCTFELRALSERLQRTNYKATASPSSDELLTKIQSLLKKKIRNFLIYLRNASRKPFSELFDKPKIRDFPLGCTAHQLIMNFSSLTWTQLG